MLNQIYTRPAMIHAIQQTLTTKKSVQLHHFLTLPAYQTLLRQCNSLPFKHSYDPTHHSYASAPITAPTFMQELSAFLALLGLSAPEISQCYQFAHRDYILRSDRTHEENEYIALLELTPSWKLTYGGIITYLPGRGTPTLIPPVTNTFSIITTTTQHRSFVQYINHTAKKNKRTYIQFIIPRNRQSKTITL